MKNKKLMFSEARFVFDLPGAPSGAGETTPPVRTTPAQLAAKKKMTAAQTSQGLNMLKGMLSGAGFSLKGKPVEVAFGGTFVKDLTGKVEALLKAKGNEALVKRFLAVAKGYGFTEKDAFELTSRLYATEILMKSRDYFHKKYPAFKTYLKEKGLKADDLKCKIEQNAQGEYVFEFKTKDSKVLAGHEEWWKKKSDADKEKAKKAGASKPKEAIPAAALERFSKSPLGKLFKHWKEGDKNMLELMQAGKAPLLALFIAGMFGYTEVSGGTFASAIAMTGKHEGKFRRYAEQAANSKLGAKAYNKKNPKKTPAVDAAEPLDSKYFAQAIESNTIPAKGLKLTEDYVIKSGENLSLDLSGGGKLILPKGAKAYVDGKLSDPGKTYENSKIVLTNTIPKGTVILGKVVFKKSAPTKAAPAKTS